jgi:hypothetical protein
MAAFLLTTGIIMWALGLVSYVPRMRDHANDEPSALSLLPSDGAGPPLIRSRA